MERERVPVPLQFRSVTQSRPIFATPWIAARQASRPPPSPGIHSDTPLESVMPSSHLILGCPLLRLPPIPPSIRVFSNESTLRMRWPKYWSFRFSIIPSKEIPGFLWAVFLSEAHTVSSTFDLLLLGKVSVAILQNGLVGSPCSPRDSQESFPAPQFKIINSSALSFLHSPTLTSIYDHRRNHSLD